MDVHDISTNYVQIKAAILYPRYMLKLIDSFLDEPGHPEDEVPDVPEVPPFERPPFPGAHGVGRRRPSCEPPPPLGKNVRRHGPLRVAGGTAEVAVVGAAPVRGRLV